MNAETRRSFIALPIVLLIGAGLALAGSQGSVQVGGVSLFALCVALAIAIQWLAFIPAYLLQTEKFYDLTGSLSFLSVTILAFVLSPGGDLRSILLAGVVIIWALRLGSFLFLRIQSAGKDDRFDEIKPNFARFLLAWTIQGLWVAFSAGAALAAITSMQRVDPGIILWVGLAVWLFGFGFEVIADSQKSQFRKDPANKGKFIRSGLWSWSRHPNYFGEILLWVGVAIMAFPALSGWQYVTLISPIFITVLLTRVSGVPMLEEKADKKWGGQDDYEDYKARTSVLVPRPPSNT